MSAGFTLIGADVPQRGVLKNIAGQPEFRCWKGQAWGIGEADEPDLDEYMRATMFGEEYSSCIDGCEPIEPDGECEHGAPSWELWWGLI